MSAATAAQASQDFYFNPVGRKLSREPSTWHSGDIAGLHAV
jgi:hypothetical protein